MIWGSRDPRAESRDVYTQTNALTGKNCTTAVHRGSLAFMVPELIIEELLIASAGIDELKTAGVWLVSMTFFTILNIMFFLLVHAMF